MLCLHIASYKTERHDSLLSVPVADDVKRNPSLEETIKLTLALYGKTDADVISITGQTGLRDGGSWDFWMFVRE